MAADLPCSRPHGDRGQRHEDGLDIPAGLEAEDRAAVIEQVELDIAASPDELMAALVLGPSAVLALDHHGRVGGKESAADILGKGKVLLPVAAVQVIVEDAADPARLA